MAEERRDAGVVVLEQPRLEPRLERLGDREVEEAVERVDPALGGDFRDRASTRLDLRPVAVEEDARLRRGEVLAEALAEGPVAIDRAELLGARRLNARERVVREQEIGVLQREVERERLAARLDVDLVPARERRGAT